LLGVAIVHESFGNEPEHEPLFVHYGTTAETSASHR